MSLTSSAQCLCTDEHHADRVQRLKDARSEASKEVNEYRKQKEEDFKTFESKVRNMIYT